MKNELQTLRLFSPLFPILYRRNEWGGLFIKPEDGELYVGFCDASDRLFIKPEDEMPPEHSFGMTMGGR